MTQPEIALLVSTYQRPRHLQRALESIALQAGVEGRMELVVTDDGSTDETPRIVADFARRVDFPVQFTTHPHAAFQLSRCRNEGARVSRAPYLLFLDGDCILPRDHVRTHLERRKPGVVMAGDCCRLEQEASERITVESIRGGEFEHCIPSGEARRLRKLVLASRFYQWIAHPTKPRLIGNNVGIWRADFARINGYDENFQGWGCEDDDLRFRLRKAGVRVECIVGWTHTYHLWHPNEASLPAFWKDGANVGYLLRRGRLTRCRNGLEKRPLADLAVRIVGRSDRPQDVERLVRGRFAAQAATRPEVEILFLPGQGRFSGQADYNVLVSLDAQAASGRLKRQAHLTIAPDTAPASAPKSAQTRLLALEQFEQALSAVA